MAGRWWHSIGDLFFSQTTQTTHRQHLQHIKVYFAGLRPQCMSVFASIRSRGGSLTARGDRARQPEKSHKSV